MFASLCAFMKFQWKVITSYIRGREHNANLNWNPLLQITCFSGVQYTKAIHFEDSKFDFVVPKKYYYTFTTHTHTHKISVCTNTLLWLSEHFPIFWMCVYTCMLFEGHINLVYWNIICGFCFSTSCWGNLTDMHNLAWGICLGANCHRNRNN